MSAIADVVEVAAELVKLAPALVEVFGGDGKTAIKAVRKIVEQRRKERDERMRKKFAK